jgi:adenylate cyclase
MPTILIIDDDQDTRERARTMLKQEGYTVLDAGDANAGIASARRHSPDLILMDLSLPVMDGWTATRIIKSDPTLASIPVVAWTATSILGGEAGARAAGYDGYFPKPKAERFGDEFKASLKDVIQATTLDGAAPARHARAQPADADARERPANIEALYPASQMLTASLDLSMVLAAILEQAALSAGATKSGLYLLDAELQLVQQFHRAGASDLPPETLEAILKTGAAGWAISHVEPVLIRDTLYDRRWVQVEEDTTSRSALLVPLIGRAGVLGVLALSHHAVGHFTESHVELLSAFAAQAAIALDNARLYDHARKERQKLLAIVDSAADAVIVTDIEGRITMANVVAGRLLGLRPDAIGAPAERALAATPLAGMFDLAARKGEPVAKEFELHGATYHASVRPVPNVGFIASLQDVHVIRDRERAEHERERRETERVRREFARHMSPQVVSLLLKRSDTLTPRKCQAAVLFSDLRNYTFLTEHIGVEAMMEYVLKRYVAVVTDVVHAQDGTIDKFLGDGIMAAFGVPFPQADAPHRALSTAMLLSRALDILRQGWQQDLGQDITVGMGLAWGEVIAGNIGSSQRVDYTVIGDPVNMAARLGALAAPGETLVSQALAEAAGKESAEWRLEALPPVMVKGKETLQIVYRAVPIWPET